MTLTAKDVAEILRLLEESNFDSLSLEMNGVKLNLQRRSPLPVRWTGEAAASAPASALPTAPPPATSSAKLPSEHCLLEIASPFVGIFYRAPGPGRPPFVEVGSKVEPDTVIGIIEVMKLMNPVSARVKGVVVEILIADDGLVEYGAILMRVRPDNEQAAS